MMKAFQPTHSTSHTAYCRERARQGMLVLNGHPLAHPRSAPLARPRQIHRDLGWDTGGNQGLSHP